MNKTTKNTFATSMFESIRESLKHSDKKGNQSFRDILKFEVGKTYLVRIVPNTKDPELTFFHYFNHSWNSMATGQFVTALCPSTYGESCPIDQERFRIWRNGSDQEKEAANMIRRKENWVCNVYVISDPTNPENEGKVKIMRYGKQVYKIIDSACNGDDVDEFGAKIFDLSSNGCTLRIKVESVAEGKKSWPTYAASRFLSPSEIPGMTDEKIKEIYTQLHDLEKLEARKTPDELTELLNVHYYGKIKPSESSNINLNTTVSEHAIEDDEIPMKSEPEVTTTATGGPQRQDDTSINDAAVEELLKDLA